jgi:hypothetical protein
MGDFRISCTNTVSPSRAAGCIAGRNEGSKLLRTSDLDHQTPEPVIHRPDLPSEAHT